MSTYPETFQGYAVGSSVNWNKAKLTSFPPKAFEANDIDIEIECCGVCGSDVHTVRGNWSELKSLVVVGHEIVGKVVRVGPNVTHYKLGDRVGVGAQAKSCLECSRCKRDNEPYCKTAVFTYNSAYPDGYISKGGYASHVRIHEHFAFPIPEGIKSEHAAPLMCGGLTVYSPLKRFLDQAREANKKYGDTEVTVGIIGIGGLGSMAVQLAKAMGYTKVYAISRGTSKKEDALKLGADGFVATAEKDWAKSHQDTFDFILNCASSISNLDLNSFLSAMKFGGTFTSVGLGPSDESFSVSPGSFIRNRSSMGSSALGSRAECIEMLELAAAKGVTPWIEEVPISEAGVNEVLTKCENGDARYRYCLTNFHEAFKTGEHKL
ncbi:hypothetical protein BABINDRAFT_162459 [Babjeviella inositovora NRRL Y-12698]|uniref:Enoyl reductase (ER) domain-containing protein n=1 Tax=Babjeviella inositovora NRRL Y-12698 TaxID=984486 RepID=A0A1E3QM52_9ASCO|nr:uncharacterized protein BABINDRAFT_162459 [Babjeviella inositovora NRRL Y-12698]ODQ78776.1 hypothetical protein BABINDRAFT_162459 [Babjeviella inositovora NRRL Y-12698]